MQVKIVTVKKPKQKKKKKTKSKSGLTVIKRSSIPIAKAATYKQFGAKTNGSRYFRVKHREFLLNVSSAGSAWETYRYNNQPGVASTFPWLSSLAANFKEYRFRKLTYIFEPNCPSTTGGALVMVPLYNPADITPTSASQAMDMKNAVNVPLWQRSSTNFSGQRFMKNLFVRTLELAPGDDSQVYDSGAFVLALDSVPIITAAGKLMVEYEVDFFVPYKTSGMASGYGAMYGLSDGTTSSAMFNQMSIQNDGTSEVVIFPPFGLHQDYLRLGQSNATPYYVVPNTIVFSAPGWYSFAWTGTYDGPIESHVTTITQLGAAVLTSFRSTSTTVLTGDVETIYVIVVVTVPNGQLSFNWSTGAVPFQLAQCAAFTLPNGAFSNTASPNIGIPCIMSMSDFKKHRNSFPILENGYQNGAYKVLSDDDFAIFESKGVLPRVSNDEAKIRIRNLRREITKLSDSLPELSDNEGEDYKDVPLIPGPREEVKQSREPLVAPVVKSASSGIGSYVGAVLGRKPGDK